jgi:hypothetical protein
MCSSSSTRPCAPHTRHARVASLVCQAALVDDAVGVLNVLGDALADALDEDASLKVLGDAGVDVLDEDASLKVLGDAVADALDEDASLKVLGDAGPASSSKFTTFVVLTFTSSSPRLKPHILINSVILADGRSFVKASAS